MNLREEVLDMKKEVKSLEKEEKSFALEILSDMKKQNKRMFVIIIILATMLFSTNAYWIYEYMHTTIEEVTETYNQDVSDIDSVGGNIINGDNYGEDKAN